MVREIKQINDSLQTQICLSCGKNRVLKSRYFALFGSTIILFLLQFSQHSFPFIYYNFLFDSNLPFDQNPSLSQISTFSIGTLFIFTPIHGLFLTQNNFTNVAFFNTVIIFLGYFIGSFVRNVDFFIFFNAIVTSIGWSGLNLCSIALINRNFSLFGFYLGIYFCFSELNYFLYPITTPYLLKQYGWPGTCQILAGISLNGIVCSLLFNIPNNFNSNKILKRPICFCKKKKISTDSIQDYKKCYIMQKILQDKNKNKDGSIGSLDGWVITSDNLLIKQSDPPSKSGTFKSSSSSSSSSSSHNDLLSPLDTQEEDSSSCSVLTESVELREKQLSNIILAMIQSKKKSFLLRKFELFKTNWICYVVLFRSLSLLVFNTSFFLMFAVMHVPNIFLLSHSALHPDQARVLLLISGISKLIYSIPLGLLIDKTPFEALFFFNISTLLLGALVLCLKWVAMWEILITFVVFSGLLMACQNLSRLILLSQLYGKEVFIQTFSISLFVEGLASFIGPLIAEIMKEKFSTFSDVFLCSGSIVITSALLGFSVKFLRKQDGTKTPNHVHEEKGFQDNKRFIKLKDSDPDIVFLSS